MRWIEIAAAMILLPVQTSVPPFFKGIKICAEL
jgi:hypothetical protein